MNCAAADVMSPPLYEATPWRDASAPANAGSGTKAAGVDAAAPDASGCGEAAAGVAASACSTSFEASARIIAMAMTATTITPPATNTFVGLDRCSIGSTDGAAAFPCPPHRPHRARPAGTSPPQPAQIRGSATYRTS